MFTFARNNSEHRLASRTGLLTKLISMNEHSTADIVLVSDTPSKSDRLVAMLRPWFRVAAVPLEEAEALTPPARCVFVVAANLEKSETFRAVQRMLEVHQRPSLFVFATFNSTSMAKATALQAEECFVWPLKMEDFLIAIRTVLASQVERSWKLLDQAQAAALESCAATMRTCFSQCRNGQDLPLDAVRDTTEKIAAAAGNTPLETWLGSIEHYHDYTFTHCMFVCFTIVAFGEAIGIRNGDLPQLTLGALLHDIGKSRIPLAILDKPAKLDADEWRSMAQHPELSRQILSSELGLERDIVGMAVHHHEKLDGTGYPDGLKGSEICDLVRLTAIADVYSALVDKRSYKPGFPPEKALEIMSEMKESLDQDFVRPFADFIMSTNKATKAAS